MNSFFYIRIDFFGAASTKAYTKPAGRIFCQRSVSSPLSQSITHYPIILSKLASTRIRAFHQIFSVSGECTTLLFLWKSNGYFRINVMCLLSVLAARRIYCTNRRRCWQWIVKNTWRWPLPRRMLLMAARRVQLSTCNQLYRLFKFTE